MTKRQCVYCNCDNPLMLTKDHIIPKVRGGPDVEENIQPCCWICNQLKGGLTDKEFKKYYRALKLLKGLYKVAINFPDKLELRFMQDHRPDYLPIRSQPKKIEGVKK